MNLSGRWKIKAKVNDVTGKINYRTVITAKDFNGETEYSSVLINFVGDAKNKPVDNDMYITVKPDNAWLSFYKKSEKETILVAVVKDFEYVENQTNDTSDRAFNNQITEVNDYGDNLPF